MNKVKLIISILLLMSEFWFVGIPVAGAGGALAYLATNDTTSAIVVFIWMTGIYFALEYSDVKEKLKSND